MQIGMALSVLAWPGGRTRHYITNIWRWRNR
jgi:hypothetical protein